MQIPSEHDLAALRFQAAARDLEHIVRHIAQRYIGQRVPLTWRLLHAIEAEALADLGLASRHDTAMLVLFQRPDGFTWPETDEPVNFGRSNALPAALAFAVAAYEDAARTERVSNHRGRGFEQRGGGRRFRAWGG